MMLKPRIALTLAGACGLLLALVILYRTPPEQSRFAPPCLFHKFTGLHCPGCGATRAVHALLHLQFGEALKKNALFLTVLPFLAVWAGRSVTRWIQGKPAQVELMTRPWAIAALVGVIFAFTLLRNLPWEPFSLLAPH